LTHTCHWPGCDRAVPPKMWGCREHWFRLPKRLRDAIWRTYVPGQEITKTPTAAYISAAKEVQAWISRSPRNQFEINERILREVIEDADITRAKSLGGAWSSSRDAEGYSCDVAGRVGGNPLGGGPYMGEGRDDGPEREGEARGPELKTNLGGQPRDANGRVKDWRDILRCLMRMPTRPCNSRWQRSPRSILDSVEIREPIRLIVLRAAVGSDISIRNDAISDRRTRRRS